MSKIEITDEQARAVRSATFDDMEEHNDDHKLTRAALQQFAAPYETRIAELEEQMAEASKDWEEQCEFARTRSTPESYTDAQVDAARKVTNYFCGENDMRLALATAGVPVLVGIGEAAKVAWFDLEKHIAELEAQLEREHSSALEMRDEYEARLARRGVPVQRFTLTPDERAARGVVLGYHKPGSNEAILVVAPDRGATPAPEQPAPETVDDVLADLREYGKAIGQQVHAQFADRIEAARKNEVK